MIIPDYIKKISHIFKKSNYSLFVVGGAVRDHLLGLIPKDFDLATDATPDQVILILQEKLKILEVGKSFGVVKVLVPEDPEGVEIATFREDIGIGRRPDSVGFTTIEKDVLRRDLTINALFYDIDKEEIVDLVGGIEDLRRGIIRTVGDPELRFGEDPLRRLRTIRFASKLGFDLHPTLGESLRRDNSLTTVSPERIRDEFVKTLKSTKSTERSLKLLDEFNFMESIFPGLDVKIDLWSRNSYILTVFLMLRNNPIEYRDKKLNKLTWSTEESNTISFLHQLQFIIEPHRAYELKRRQPTVDLINEDVYMEFSHLMKIDSNIMEAFLRYEIQTDGNDLLKEGFLGKDLGIELRRRETEFFKQLIR
jgi:tRNA nucleotidyltransferase/poly(A) polymerase